MKIQYDLSERTIKFLIQKYEESIALEDVKEPEVLNEMKRFIAYIKTISESKNSEQKINMRQ